MNRIGTGTAFFLYAVAISIDAAQFIVSLTGIGMIVAPFGAFAALLFGIWFSILGVSILDPKRVLRFFFTTVAESVPLFDMWPWWTITVWYTIRESRREEEDI